METIICGYIIKKSSIKHIAGLLIIELAIVEFIIFNNYIKKKGYELEKLELILFEIPIVILIFRRFISTVVEVEIKGIEFFNYFLSYLLELITISTVILLGYYYLVRTVKIKQHISLKILGKYYIMTILNILIIYILPYPNID